MAFNPAMAFISGAWGQVDMIPAIMLLGVIYLFDSGKLELAGLLYGAAIITKPQSLMIGPLLAVAYFAKVYDKGWRYALRTLAAVALAVMAIFALAWPFKGAQQPLWFMDKLLGTATSYPYASVEAFNGAAGGQLGKCERTAAGPDLWQMGEHYDSALMHSRSCGIHKVTG